MAQTKPIYQTGLRFAVYLIGVVLMTVGIVLCVKCSLGISPVSCIPYVISLMTPLSLGTLTLFFHLVNVVLQYILERKPWNSKVLLQVPVAVLFGLLIDLFKKWMDFSAEHLALKLLLMALSILCTALGMHLMLSMKLVQNPPDGAVKLIAEKLGKKTGNVKMLYDIFMVVLSVGISLLALHRVEGFGIATIFSAVFVGKCLDLCKRFFPFPEWPTNSTQVQV